MEEVRLNALWIDDKFHENNIKRFLNVASKYGIDITPVSYVDEGLALLKDQTKVWDAVILDCNCKKHSDEEAEDIGALSYAIESIREIDKRIKWFPFSAGEGFAGANVIPQMVGEKCDWLGEKKLYKKLDYHDQVALCERIREVAQAGELYDIQQAYKDVFRVLNNQSLLILLYNRQNNPEEFKKAADVPNKLRGIVDELFKYFEKVGLLSPGDFNGTNLKACYEFMRGYSNKIIPRHVKSALNYLIEYVQAGSHRYTPVSSQLIHQENQYLNNSAIEILMMVVAWAGSLGKNGDEINKERGLLPPMQIIGTLEQDDLGNYHIDKYYVPSRCGKYIVSDHLGHDFVIKKSSSNRDEESQSTYPMFANNIELYGDL